MATYIVTEVTTAELATLVATSALEQGLQYKDTETDNLYLATSINTLRIINSDTLPIIYSKKIQFNNNQIKLLSDGAAMTEIIPPPGLGKSIMFLQAFLYGNFIDDYTNIHATESLFNLWMNDPISTYLLNDGTSSSLSQFFAPGPTGPKVYAYLSPIIFNSLIYGGYSQCGFTLGHSYENEALNLSFYNGGNGALTGGNAANTLSITVIYTIIDFS